MKAPLIVRQGDVLLRQIDTLPAGASKIDTECGDVVIAYGEVTGHRHRLAFHDAEMYSGMTGGQFVRVLKDGASLLHEEHSTATLPASLYQRIEQVEHTDADEPLIVAD